MEGIGKLILLAILYVIIVGLLIMGLWNWLMPVIFGLPKIDYSQSCGLMVLSSLLLSGPSSRIKWRCKITDSK